jgi:hypothetical protein
VLYSEIKNIKANRNPDNISIYPNPIRDKLVISFHGSNDLQSVRIINGSGQVVRSVKSGITGNRIMISVNDLPVGKYYIEAVSEDGVSTRAFIKN